MAGGKMWDEWVPGFEVSGIFFYFVVYFSPSQLSSRKTVPVHVWKGRYYLLHKKKM